jgi:hypothetical protein
MSKKPVVFAIESDDKPRRLLSVNARSSGDLLVSLNASVRARAPGTPINEPSPELAHNRKIIEYRYSVHPSKNSPHGANVIKLTRTLDDGTQITGVINTCAIKADSGFEPIFVRRYTNLRDPYYDINGSPKAIVMDSYHTSFTLVLGLFVGPAGREFRWQKCDDFKFIERDFNTFRLILLWSFLGMPATDSGHFFHVATAAGHLSNGLDESDCIKCFNSGRAATRAEFLQTLSSKYPPECVRRMKLRAPSFFRDCNIRNPAFVDYLTWMFGVITIDPPD